MNSINQKIEEIRQKEKIGLMTHVVIGYPTIAETIAIVKTMEKSGADIVELQIPFSDPLADGPTIMRACETSLAQGTRVADAFAVMKKLSQEVSIPLLFMAYYNTVFHYGVENFCRDAAFAGAAGLIVPDMPIDEEPHEKFYQYCSKYNLTPIHVVSPASTDERLKKNAAVAKGFVYFTARQGITGAKAELDPNLEFQLERVKKYFSIPVAVGFGISKSEHIEALARKADIAVIGSALIDVITHAKKNKLQQNLTQFLSELTIY